jgi:putative addiction module component (TIGR02574 family)
MRDDAAAIIKAALELPPEERERIVIELSASLSGDFASKEIEAVWLDEIERRSQEIDAGTAELVDWSEVRKKIAQRRARRAG